MTDSKSNEIVPSVISSGDVREQAILPWGIALRITLRGLKIRFGRSLITMSGVVLGIAFLMSVLTGEGLRSGLADENRTKTEVNRLLKLVEGEVGTIAGHKISVLLTGPIKSDHKLRLMERIAAQADPGSILVYTSTTDALAPTDNSAVTKQLNGPAYAHTTDINTLFDDAHVVLLLHQDLPQIPNETFVNFLTAMAQPVLLDYNHGRYSQDALQQDKLKTQYSSLSYEMSEEEIARAEKREARNKARQIWITVISMLVTVIGIANAMLMSVTERIREIGTMKCLGALSNFVVKLFLIESFMIGVAGAILGTALGFVVPFVAYMLSSGMALLFYSTPFMRLVGYGIWSTLAGTILAILAAIYPAIVAARMVPADALRSNV